MGLTSSKTGASVCQSKALEYRLLELEPTSHDVRCLMSDVWCRSAWFASGLLFLTQPAVLGLLSSLWRPMCNSWLLAPGFYPGPTLTVVEFELVDQTLCSLLFSASWKKGKKEGRERGEKREKERKIQLREVYIIEYKTDQNPNLVAFVLVSLGRCCVSTQ